MMKQMLKRTGALLLTLCLTLSVWGSIGVWAKPESIPSFSLATNQTTYQPQDIVTITVHTTPVKLASASVQLEFDPSVLTFYDFIPNKSQGMMAASNPISPGKVNISYIITPPENAVILDAVFDVRFTINAN